MTSSVQPFLYGQDRSALTNAPRLGARGARPVRSGRMTGPVRVGVDIGGTFTNLLAMDERSRRTFVLRQASTASPVDARGARSTVAPWAAAVMPAGGHALAGHRRRA